MPPISASAAMPSASWHTTASIRDSCSGRSRSSLRPSSRSNDRRMRAIGFPTYRYRLAAFVIAGTLGGLAGALLANNTDFVSPAMMHWTRSGDLIVMVVFGGMGSLFGPLIGAMALLALE